MKTHNVRQKIQTVGSWTSRITPAHMASSLKISDVQLSARGHTVWLEGRGDKRVLVVGAPDGSGVWELNVTSSIGAKVGYGGGDFTLHGEDVFYVDAESDRIYRQALSGGEAFPLTPAFGNVASPRVSPDGKWVIFIHSYEGLDTLAIVDTAGRYWPQKLIFGEDYYMQPVWHPKNRMIAWVAWNAPNMPWDGTQLWVGTLRESRTGLPSLASREIIAGGERVSIFQPEFSPDGRHLAYVSDESGWWQLYLRDLKTGETMQLTNTPAEHAQPAWVQGMRTYAFDPSGRGIYFLRNQNARITAHFIEFPSGEERQVILGEEYTYLEQISLSRGRLALLASGARAPLSVVSLRPNRKEGTPQVWRRSMALDLSPEIFSTPEIISWEPKGDEIVHALFYPPHHPNFRGAGAPPLVLSVHGGPTSQRFDSFNLNAQFFTSRGFAYLELNHRGSTGYGRAYRNLLRGNWGLYDLQDAVSAVRHLADMGKIDPQRAVIMGGSAGGYTVLRALQEHPGFFKAGIALYPVGNLFALAAETHKFEAHYLDSMIGPLPESAEAYRQRSPVFHAECIQDPLALFQGEDDKVVPKSQSDDIAAALRGRGVPLIYHAYPEEGHGFRKPETMIHLYQAIEKFLREYVLYR